MAIIYHPESRQFHLTNGKISYILSVLENDELTHLYFGAALRDRLSFDYLNERTTCQGLPCVLPDRLDFSMSRTRQEYPSFGHGDVRDPAYEIRQENGSMISEFRYKTHRIFAGKPKLCGLPATYTESDDEAETLEIDLYDEKLCATITLCYTVFASVPAIARSVRFTNGGTGTLMLERALSASVDFADKDYDMIWLSGAWSRERSVNRAPLCSGIRKVYSRLGCSGNTYNPFLALVRPETTENSGEAYGFSLVYSGNYLAQVEVDPFNVSRVMLGINPDGFSWPLRKGESFTTPETVAVYSPDGLSGMSRAFHTLYRERLARSKWRSRPRPILLNSWEAAYFDFDEEKLLRLARTAAETGIELFVMDDGWFGTRTSDKTGLGDWYPNKERFPNGLGAFGKRIRELGLEFGIWIEPEMVNPDSDLYRAHPEWTLCDPARSISQARFQYVLDYSRPEVVDYIFRSISAVLRESGVSYVKWDMNRFISECFSAALPPEEQGTVYHRYILGVYDLYERLTSEFPDILFESCASGGARFDPGLLYYAPQCWTSDNTDAMQRVEIQYGTSFVYPLSSLGAHVSASPNHALNRSSSLSARADVAVFGTFGYELDLTKLSEAELCEIREQIAWMKEHRALMQFGDFYRLISPFEKPEAAWMVVSPDKKQAVAAWYRLRQPANSGFSRLRLTGLCPQMNYLVEPLGCVFGGDELMHAGLSTSDLEGDMPCDSKSRRFVLTAVPDEA